MRHRLHKLHYALTHRSWILTEWVLILVALIGYSLVADTFEHRLIYLSPLFLYSILILALLPKPEEPEESGLLIQVTFVPAYLITTLVTIGGILATLYALSLWLGGNALTQLSAHALPAPAVFPYLLISALLLEWIFRQFVMTRLEKLSHHWLVDVILTSILFTLTQTALDSPFLILAAFVGSVAISRVYYLKPSWILASLAHAGIFGTLLVVYATWQG